MGGCGPGCLVSGAAAGAGWCRRWWCLVPPLVLSGDAAPLEAVSDTVLSVSAVVVAVGW